jgi:hypothetical protein
MILTSHGSRAGLAVKAGSRIEVIAPANLVRMLNDTMVRHRVVIISALLFRGFRASARGSGHAGDHCGGWRFCSSRLRTSELASANASLRLAVRRNAVLKKASPK